MNFTQGEWQCAESANELDFLVFSGDSQTRLIAITDESTVADKYRDKEKAEANAKLIAAAPDLLESCIGLLADLRQILINDCLDMDQDEETAIKYAESFDVLKRAKAAIKKATE